MNLPQAQSALEVERNAFQETVHQPNTVARNVVLAGHRNEMARLEKLIAKFEAPSSVTAK